MSFLYHLLFGISTFGFIFSMAFLIRRKPQAYYFFIGVYLIFNFSLFVNVSIPLGFIDKMPHLYRVVSPLQFLFGPLSYFFFRATLRPYQRFAKWDWLHFLPFFVSIIGLIPIFLLSADEKMILIDLARDYKTAWYQKDTFGLDYVVSFRIKFISFFIYLFFQWRMILGYMRNASVELRQNNKSLRVWLLFDITLKSLICVILFCSTWLESYAGLASVVQMALVSLEIMISAFFLIASPELLKGVEFKGVILDTLLKRDEDLILGSPEKNIEVGVSKKNENVLVMSRIEQFLQLEQPFLDPEFGVIDLSRALQLPGRTISSAIKSTLGIGFPEYINKKRLSYLEHKLQISPELHNFSVDALAKMTGFNSRSGFYKAFKKNGPKDSPAKMIAMIREKSTLKE